MEILKTVFAVCVGKKTMFVCCDIKTLTTDNRQWLKATNATYCTWSLLDRTCEINRTYSFLPALFTGSTTHRQTVSEPACSKKLRSGLDVLPLTGDLNGNISASCWMSAPAFLPVHWHTSRKFPHTALSRLFQGHNFHFLPTSPQLCETNQPSLVPNMSKHLLARQQSCEIRCCSNAWPWSGVNLSLRCESGIG